MSMSEVRVRTVRAQLEYRAHVVRAPDGATQSYTLLRAPGEDAVYLYTAHRCLGGYRLHRFGGALTPAGIRTFFGLDAQDKITNGKEG